MTSWTNETAPDTCPRCVADTGPWRRDVDCDWRDDTEREDGIRAVALNAHMHDHHRVVPNVGDLVRYTMAWRGLLLTSDTVFKVEATREQDSHGYARDHGYYDGPPLMVTRYYLVNPHRTSDYSLPDTGDPDMPVTFTIVDTAPVVQTDLMDLLGWELQA